MKRKDKKSFREIIPTYFPRWFRVVKSDEYGGIDYENTDKPRLSEFTSVISRWLDEPMQLYVDEVYDVYDMDSWVYEFDWQGKVKGVETTPPTNPEENEKWICGSGSINEWIGHDDEIAIWNGSEWEFYLKDKVAVYNEKERKYWIYDKMNGGWREADRLEYVYSDWKIKFKTEVVDILTNPPASPNVGDRYVVNLNATGDWENHDGEIAIWNGTNWEFEQSENGEIIYNQSNDRYYKYYADYKQWVDEDDIVKQKLQKEDSNQNLINRRNIYVKLIASQLGENITEYDWIRIKKNFLTKNFVNLYKIKGLYDGINAWCKMSGQEIKEYKELWTFDYCHFIPEDLLFLWTYGTEYDEEYTEDEIEYYNPEDGNTYTTTIKQLAKDVYEELKQAYDNVYLYGEKIWKYKIKVKKWRYLNRTDNEQFIDKGLKFNEMIPDNCCMYEDKTGCNNNDFVVLTLNNWENNYKFNEDIATDEGKELDHAQWFTIEFPFPKGYVIIPQAYNGWTEKQKNSLQWRLRKILQYRQQYRFMFDTPHFLLKLKLNPNYTVEKSINEILKILVKKVIEYKAIHTVIHLYLEIDSETELNINVEWFAKLLQKALADLIHWSTHLIKLVTFNEQEYNNPQQTDINENIDTIYYTTGWSYMEAYGEMDIEVDINVDNNIYVSNCLRNLILSCEDNTSVNINSDLSYVLNPSATGWEATLTHWELAKTDTIVTTDIGGQTDTDQVLSYMTTELEVNFVY